MDSLLSITECPSPLTLVRSLPTMHSSRTRLPVATLVTVGWILNAATVNAQPPEVETVREETIEGMKQQWLENCIHSTLYCVFQLLSLRQALVPPGSDRFLTDWSFDPSSNIYRYCDWTGITCAPNSDRVVGITLTGNEVGPFPGSVRRLMC